MNPRHIDGLKHALGVAQHTTDEFWNEEFKRHGNPGLATMKQKVGKQIEEAIQAEIDRAESAPNE